jgi:Raf kinase inhibitor-like YbhB/YbcL family protein
MMKKKIALILVVFSMTVGVSFAGDFSISSPQVASHGKIANEQVFNGFGCQGDNISPALQWQGAPEGTVSFAVTVYDPDAPTGSGWWHWVIFNIPANVTNLAMGAGDPQSRKAPAGSVQSMTDFGRQGYGGPCPPAGDKAHHYEFTVYALKAKELPLDENTPAAMVGFYIHQNLLGKAVLTATYGR